MMKRDSKIQVCVTGAGGYLGRHVCAQLLDQGIRPIAIDISDVNVDERCDFVKKDIFSEGCGEISNADCLIHLAWKDGFVHNAESHIDSLPLHFRFLRNMIQNGCRSVAVMGSMHEVGYWRGAINENTPCNPMSYYGVVKNALRQMMFAWIKTSGVDVSFKWLRGFYIVGDDSHNNSVFSKILRWDHEGKKMFPFTDGTNQYDFISVHDIARQIVKATLQNKYSGIINCCSGKPQRLRDVVDQFIKKRGLKIRPDYGAYPVRDYDSPLIYGDASIINRIMET